MARLLPPGPGRLRAAGRGGGRGARRPPAAAAAAARGQARPAARRSPSGGPAGSAGTAPRGLHRRRAGRPRGGSGVGGRCPPGAAPAPARRTQRAAAAGPITYGGRRPRRRQGRGLRAAPEPRAGVEAGAGREKGREGKERAAGGSAAEGAERAGPGRPRRRRRRRGGRGGCCPLPGRAGNCAATGERAVAAVPRP